MHKYISLLGFMRQFFDEDQTARKAAEIGEAMLAAQSLRLMEIAAKMHSGSAAAYKQLQRFLQQADPRGVL